MELDAQRTVGQLGLNPITYSDIKCWADLTDRAPKPHEVSALMRLDATLRVTVQAKPERK